MSKYVIDDSTLASIAEAIRGKTGGTDPIAVTDMAAQIASITGGGSSDEVILEEQDVLLALENGMYVDMMSAPNPIAVGETYKVVWGDSEGKKEYECTAFSMAGTGFETYGSVAMGNTVLLNGTDIGVPFLIVYNAVSAQFIIVSIYATEPYTPTLAIYKASGGSIEGVVYVTFKNWDGTDLVTKPVFIGNSCMDVVANGTIETPTRESTNTQTFEYSGWSLTAGGAADASALLNVDTDRTVYAAYTASTRYYTVRFFDGDTLLHTVLAEYGSTPSYVPTKDGEVFDSWNPAIVPVVADADYYAVWSVAQTYGVEWDYSKSATTLTRTENAVGFSNPVPATSLTETGSSPFDSIMPWAGMKRYNIIDGAVAYSEDDAGFSMTDYDTVVYIPPFYYSANKDTTNSKWSWSISPAPKDGYALHPGSGRYIGRYHTSVDENTEVFSKSGIKPVKYGGLRNFRTYSHNKGNNWWVLDIATWSALQLLYLVEYADFHSQKVLGNGYGENNKIAGATDEAIYHSYNGGDTANQYRWVELPWGIEATYIDGVMTSSRTCYIGTDNSTFDNSISVLTSTGIKLPSEDLKIKGLGYSDKFPWAFIPNEYVSGNDVYIPDNSGASSSGERVAFVGGGCFEVTGQGGMFRLNCTTSATATSTYKGSRLIFIP